MQKETIMTKNSKQSETTFRKLRLPKEMKMFAVVIEMSGGSRFRALCADNKTRMISIGGKLKKRMWVEKTI
jgi:initiation factor 1A